MNPPYSTGVPDSCVVVTPEVAADTHNGSAFVKSLLNVLRKEKDRIHYLTVQSLAKRIQVDNKYVLNSAFDIHCLIIRISSDNGAVHCFGKRADCFLLNRDKGGYHSFILGQKEIGGRIILSAGTAQGIEPKTRLAFFVSDVKDAWNDKYGYLVVDSASATSAVVRPSDASKKALPPIFYAAETQYPNEIIRVRIEGEQPLTGPFQPKSFSWVKQEPDKANITLQFNYSSEGVTFFWNGLESDNSPRVNYKIDAADTSQSSTVRMLRVAARLTYHLSRPSPANVFAKGLHIQLQKILGSGKGRKPSDEDLLQNGCMSTTPMDETYCLVVKNETKTDLWPYVLTFDPRNLNICKF